MAVFPYAVQYIFVADLFFIKGFNPIPLSLLSFSLLPLVTISLFSIFVNLFLFCYVHLL